MTAKAVAMGGRIEVRRDPITGQLEFPTAVPGTLQSVVSYERNGKDKVLFAHGTSSSGAFADEYQQLSSSFDRLAIVDTNTRQLGGMSLSVGCAYYTRSNVRERDVPWEVHLVAAFAIVNVASHINAEVLGWHLFLSSVWPRFLEVPPPRVGLVVDSELGQHQAFNSGQKPYYRHYRMPPKIQLVYASADAGRLATNKLMRVCDTAATQCARRICRDGLLLSKLAALRNGNEDYQGAALWFYRDPPPGGTENFVAGWS